MEKFIVSTFNDETPTMPAKKTATSSAPKLRQLIVTAEGLNVREAPTLQAKVVDILSRGDIVQWIGASGDGYFHKISHNGTEGCASHKYLQFETTPAPASNDPWFEIAHAEVGTREVTGSGDNPRIVAYHRSASLDAPSASNDKRVGVAPRADRVGLPENATAKAVGVDCGARFLKTHPVVDPISHGWYFDDPVFLKDLTFTLAGDMDRNVIPTRVTTPTLSLTEK